MATPVIILVLCLCAGVTASVRWLPDLAEGLVGGLAFFTVCGLLGASLGLFGLHIYSIAEEVNGFGIERGAILASNLESMFWETGSMLALAAIVYLLAPHRETADESVTDPVA